MRVLSWIMVCGGMCMWVLGLHFGSYYLSEYRPKHPKPEAGQIITFNNHGTVTYISERDNLIFYLGTYAGLFSAFIGGALVARQQHRK
jgi:hypothetical protein